MSPDRHVLAKSALRRLELWVLLVALLTAAQLQAESYLASFGSPNTNDVGGWNLAIIAYDVRHLPTLFVLFLAPMAIVLVLLWIFLALSAPPTARRLLGRVLAITLLAGTVPVAVNWPASEIRREGFRRIAERMAPLVSALHRFEADMGRPPHELAELTPRYLTTVHEFGVRGCCSLQYSLGSPHVAWRWQVWLECPNGLFNLDRFFLLSNRDYADWGDIERVGDWAYRWD